MDYALSFIAQIVTLNSYPDSFFSAFVRVVQRVGLRKLSSSALKSFMPFLKQFKPDSMNAEPSYTG